MTRNIVCYSGVEGFSSRLAYGWITAMVLTPSGGALANREVLESLRLGLQAVAENTPLGDLGEKFLDLVERGRPDLDQRLWSVYKAILERMESHVVGPYPGIPCEGKFPLQHASPSPQNLADGVVNYLVSEARNLTSLLLGREVQVPVSGFYRLNYDTADHSAENCVELNESKGVSHWFCYVQREIGKLGGFAWRHEGHAQDVVKWLEEESSTLENWRELPAVCLRHTEAFGSAIIPPREEEESGPFWHNVFTVLLASTEVAVVGLLIARGLIAIRDRIRKPQGAFNLINDTEDDELNSAVQGGHWSSRISRFLANLSSASIWDMTDWMRRMCLRGQPEQLPQPSTVEEVLVSSVELQ
eukprot:Protomagalhaensia_wolfi_Nauph_80__1572@NODE_1967_length_1262_cov_15_144726_g1540_i0_p1_GENE_NODE_1967_length_1262_cov_15_144726_g1540_i0NODE_1967_length_1262_cov_15_144726_g1540_i0_p1_ORF_typecomplete_len370_score42_49_NODE_1967_length_1262_cov_15_144726_g1540_i0391112